MPYYHRMRTRRFGRLGWQVSAIGHGLWGMGGWMDSDDEASLAALDRSIELGCTYFDTALSYGDGKSERLLGQALAKHRGRGLYVASKVPPKNLKWPASPDDSIADVFPADHIRKATEESLTNLGLASLDRRKPLVQRGLLGGESLGFGLDRIGHEIGRRLARLRLGVFRRFRGTVAAAGEPRDGPDQQHQRNQRIRFRQFHRPDLLEQGCVEGISKARTNPEAGETTVFFRSARNPRGGLGTRLSSPSDRKRARSGGIW